MSRKDLVHMVVIPFGVAFAGLATLLAAIDGMGVRKTVEEYNATYQGKLAIVKKEFMNFGMPRSYLLLNGKDRIEKGEFSLDNGNTLIIGDGHYSVKTNSP